MYVVWSLPPLKPIQPNLTKQSHTLLRRGPFESKTSPRCGHELRYTLQLILQFVGTHNPKLFAVAQNCAIGRNDMESIHPLLLI